MTEKNTEIDFQRLRDEVERVLDWGKADTWHSKMFTELSNKIFEQTNVMLSAATLKRFFGVVKHEGNPSITTLDTLSQFIGKENWRAFKTEKKKVQRLAFKISKPSKSAYVIFGFFLALVTFSIISSKSGEVVVNASEFKFSSKVLSREFPNSVIFNLEIPKNLQSDSLLIQQYWDETKTVAVHKSQKTATAIYYHPGYFGAKLRLGDQIVKEHDLFLKSNGWLGQIEYNPIPKYFEPILKGDSGIYLSETVQTEVKALEKPVVTTYHYIDDLGNISGDNFTLEATLQTTFDDRWAVCQKIRIYFLAKEGAMIIPFSKIGCSSDNNIMLNDVYLNGKENDLSALSADFSTPTQLKVEVKNKVVTVSIAGEEIYTLGYTDTMGNLVGLRFKFLGLGEVIDYKLFDQQLNKITF